MNDPVFRGTPASALDPQAAGTLQRQLELWEGNEVASFVQKAPERKAAFATLGGFPVKRTYTALDLADTPLSDIGLPGQYPFTRGPYPTMYRGRFWTMRQIAGFGTAEDTNKRFKYLIANGQTGLSTDFDMPTLMGYDSDHPMSEGEVGREGVAIDTLADMEHLFDGIDLEKISVSMTINPSAWILLAMYVALAKKKGYDLDRLSGTIQADILKEYQAQKEWIYPVAPSVRIVRDCITYCAQNMKRYNPINISGYHVSEAGSSPLRRGRLHDVQPHHLRGGGDQDGDARRPVRAAPGLLLRLPGGLLRGDRQVPRGAPRVREDHEGALRCAGIPSRCGCASTARPPRRRSPSRSTRSTSCAPACRRSPRCWAARRACTPTAWTRRSRSPPRRR